MRYPDLQRKLLVGRMSVAHSGEVGLLVTKPSFVCYLYKPESLTIPPLIKIEQIGHIPIRGVMRVVVCK